jgi:hypothetical protein
MSKRQDTFSKRQYPFKTLDPQERYVARFVEKHGETTYVILSEAELDAVCLDMLSSRLKSGHWYYQPEVPTTPQPAYTKEEAENLRGNIKEVALREIVYYSNSQRDYIRRKEEYDRIVKAVQDKDGVEAFNILRDRGGHEYESFELKKASRIPAYVK